MIRISNKKLLSNFFSTLSSESRLSALELFAEKQGLTEIANSAGMSRTGFQKVIKSFYEQGIIEPTRHRSYYKLSEKGKRTLKMVSDFSRQLESVTKESDISKTKQLIHHSTLTVEDLKELVNELKHSRKK